MEAGRAIMDVYRSDFATAKKSDCSPVTEADKAAEKIILISPTQGFIATGSSD